MTCNEAVLTRLNDVLVINLNEYENPSRHLFQYDRKKWL